MTRPPAHALAHSLAVEDALGIELPDEAQRLRALLVELERLYNHAADLGALANDVGFGIANAHAQRIREQLLRVNAAVTGHRLLRGAITPAACASRSARPAELQSIAADLAESRRADTGQHHRPRPVRRHLGAGPDDARAIGCLGYVARASGIRTDARLEHPAPPCPSPRPVAPRATSWPATRRRDEFAASAALARI